ncbi:MAG: TetR/AcrR family transcriptional regulator [Brevundimonas sp.]|uniref:TetR/AcrR family transcriptional regulator n=1 Tax=Brevundimonas sp. TaxID=1871086 RepID=UPI0017BE99B9|nr:TetR/AcrR family transcriptional regulator [Brevundimonas sp.]MBA4803249.1 TetR/AcrR family transcriptional regulator [Brevundimonas sp.]
MPAEAPASARSRRKPKGEGHERRAEILAAAERIFVEHGYEGATIRKIADEVGLSSTALYMHFADKGEILQEICRQAFETLQQANDRAVAQSGPPEARMRRMMQAYVAFGFANPDAYRLVYMTRPAELREGAQSAARELGVGLFRAFEQVVEELEAAGRLRVDARTAAQALWAGGHGVVSLMISKPYFEWVDRDTLAATMIEGLLAGLLRP